MFFITWVIRVFYYIIDLVFASVFQTVYDRFTGNSPSVTTARQSNTNQIRIFPPTPLWVYVVGTFALIVAIDRFSVFVGHYSERDAEERWAVDTLETMCGDDKQYRGRIYADNCMQAYRIKNSGRISSAFHKMAADTHLCVWWDCTTLTYNTITSMPSVTAIIIVLFVTILMCGGGLGGGGLPQTITLLPAPVATPVSTPNTPDSRN